MSFVRNSYYVLCKKFPDDNRMNYYLSNLRNGRKEKLDIMWEMRHENKFKKYGVARLRIEYYKFKLKQILFYKVPVFSYLLRLIFYIITLPWQVEKIHAIYTETDIEINRAFKKFEIINNRKTDPLDENSNRILQENNT